MSQRFKNQNMEPAGGWYYLLEEGNEVYRVPREGYAESFEHLVKAVRDQAVSNGWVDPGRRGVEGFVCRMNVGYCWPPVGGERIGEVGAKEIEKIRAMKYSAKVSSRPVVGSSKVVGRKCSRCGGGRVR